MSLENNSEDLSANSIYPLEISGPNDDITYTAADERAYAEGAIETEGGTTYATLVDFRAEGRKGLGTYILSVFVVDAFTNRGASEVRMSMINPAVVEMLGKIVGDETLEYYHDTTDANGNVERHILPITSEQAKQSIERSQEVLKEYEDLGLEPEEGFSPAIKVRFKKDELPDGLMDGFRNTITSGVFMKPVGRLRERLARMQASGSAELTTMGRIIQEIVGAVQRAETEVVPGINDTIALLRESMNQLLNAADDSTRDSIVEAIDGLDVAITQLEEEIRPAVASAMNAANDYASEIA